MAKKSKKRERSQRTRKGADGMAAILALALSVIPMTSGWRLFVWVGIAVLSVKQVWDLRVPWLRAPAKLALAPDPAPARGNAGEQEGQAEGQETEGGEEALGGIDGIHSWRHEGGQMPLPLLRQAGHLYVVKALLGANQVSLVQGMQQQGLRPVDKLDPRCALLGLAWDRGVGLGATVGSHWEFHSPPMDFTPP